MGLLALFGTILLFALGILGLFFVPGFLLLRTILNTKSLSSFETLLFSCAMSIGSLDVVMLLLARFGITLSAVSLVLGLLGLLLFAFVLSLAWFRFGRTHARSEQQETPPLKLSRNGTFLLLLLLLSTLFIKTLALESSAIPTATDLGHHMFWAKSIVTTGVLPEYAKIDVVMDAEGIASVALPRTIPDFIVGEHLPFAAFSFLTQLDFLSAFPVSLLNLINLLSILATAVLAWRLSQDFFSPRHQEIFFLLTFFFLGPLYTLASPQTKFVSGGVIGNSIGNFLIPLILLLFYRAAAQKRSDFLGLGLFLTFILAYTHHLSTLMLGFILITSLGTLLAFRFTHWRETLSLWWQLLWHPIPLGLLTLFFIFIFSVALPAYLNPEVIGSAIGTPTKTTRTGLSFFQVTNSIGMAKVAFGLIGLLLSFVFFRKSLGGTIAFTWGAILLLMTLYPEWVFLDIPSSRIGSFLTYPLALAAALAFTFLLRMIQQKTLPPMLGGAFFLLAFFFVSTQGILENSQALPNKAKSSTALETFAVSQYLSEETNPNTIILKDHNYVAADAWMKLFFMRDYGYPLSRGFFSRYTEGGNRREHCTLNMISIPNTPEGKKCYEETKTSLIVVNPRYDTAQFEKSVDFSRLYVSDSVAVYARH